jgi:regulator of replication initiation timing
MLDSHQSEMEAAMTLEKRIAELEQQLRERDAYIELLKTTDQQLSEDNQRLFLELERARRAAAQAAETTKTA